MNKRKRDYFVCRRKCKFSQRKANRVKQRLNESQKKKVHSYYCDVCGQRHVGKAPDQLTGKSFYSELGFDESFEDLSPDQQLVFNIIAESANEVWQDWETRNVANS